MDEIGRPKPLVGPRLVYSLSGTVSGGGANFLERALNLQKLGITPNPNRPAIIKKILIVEDEPVNVRAIKRFLPNGMETIELEEGDKEQLRGIILSQRPDLIIMDGNLPGLKGPELVRFLREEMHFQGYIFGNSTQADLAAALITNGADIGIDKKYTLLKELFS